MKTARHILITTFLSIVCYCCSAQDLNFSQFYELPLLRNPALAGVFIGDVRVQSVYRNQWQSVTVPFRTEGVSAEMKFPIANSADLITVGLQIVNDEAGDSRLHRTQLLPVFNYQKSIAGDKDVYISGAVMGGFVSSQFDPTNLKWGDQFVNGSYSAANPTSQILKNTGRTYFDLSTGLSFNAPVGTDGRWYAGVGYFHLNKPKIAFDAGSTDQIKLAPKWAFNIGLSTPTNDFNKFTLYGDYFLQGGNRQFMGGAIYSLGLTDYSNVTNNGGEENNQISIGLGMFYRWDDAVIPVFKLDYYDWGMGLSYDINTSKLSTASQSQGGFELTLNYKGSFINRNPDLRKTQCPHL